MAIRVVCVAINHKTSAIKTSGGAICYMSGRDVEVEAVNTGPCNSSTADSPSLAV